MKIPYYFDCITCHKRNELFGDLNADNLTLECECGQNYPHLPTDHIKGRSILRRAKYECETTDDYAMCIVFSATAFECELAALHHRWHAVKTLETQHRFPTDIELEEKIRKYPSIDRRINHVASLFGYKDMNDFVEQSPELKNVVTNGFPSIRLGHIAEDIQKNLFWPRNRVLHLGYTKFDKQEATKCYNIAKLGVVFVQAINDVWAGEKP